MRGGRVAAGGWCGQCRCGDQRGGGGATCGGVRWCGALLVCVVLYSAAGGALFYWLEGGEGARGEAVVVQVDEGAAGRAAGRLWQLTEHLNVLHRHNWTRGAHHELRAFQQDVLRGLRGKGGGPAGGERWSYAASCLYALALITTVGDGAVTPPSPLGKLAAILYSCVGIPLVLLYVAGAGALLARGARALCGAGTTRSPPHTAAPARPALTPFEAALNLSSMPSLPRVCHPLRRSPPRWVPATLLLLYVCAGVLLPRGEDGGVLDALLASFLTVSTVGGAAGLRGQAGGGTVSAVLHALYLVLGAALLAGCGEMLRRPQRAPHPHHTRHVMPPAPLPSRPRSPPPRPAAPRSPPATLPRAPRSSRRPAPPRRLSAGELRDSINIKSVTFRDQLPA